MELLFDELMGHHNQTIVSHNLTENQKDKNSETKTYNILLSFSSLPLEGVSFLNYESLARPLQICSMSGKYQNSSITSLWASLLREQKVHSPQLDNSPSL